MERTTCCVVGGGPAGMVLGLLLARAGVAVTVLEKHGDFLRDFRGDTVHPSTLALLDDLGLAGQFGRLPQRRVTTVQLPLGPDRSLVTVGNIGALRGKYNYIAMVPQWDLLNLLVDEAGREPSFSVRMNTEATAFLMERTGVPLVERSRELGAGSRGSGTARPTDVPVSCGPPSPWPATAGPRWPGRCPNWDCGSSPARWTPGGSGCPGGRTTRTGSWEVSATGSSAP